jgi:hypothetical protein
VLIRGKAGLEGFRRSDYGRKNLGVAKKCASVLDPSIDYPRHFPAM